MNQQIPINDLLKACEILFNTDLPITKDFFRTLDDSTLKTAYRKKAFETHPDRSKALGKNEDQMIKKFKEVTKSYEILKPIVGKKLVFAHAPLNRNPQPPPTDIRPKETQRTDNENIFRKQAGSHPKEQTESYDNHFYKGPMPQFELRLNKFLYYFGMIPWRTYIDSIIWEKKQRPMFGQIAHYWHFLTQEDIRHILHQRVYPEKFGEFALRNGYLSSFQHMAILGRQRLMTPAPDTFFIEKGVFTIEELDGLIREHQAFNQKIRAMSDFK